VRFRGGIRQIVLLVGLAVAAGGCGEGVAAGEATNENAIAAYVNIELEPFAPGEFDRVDTLTMAGPGDLASPAGFFRGIRSAGAIVESDGMSGLELLFQTDVTTANRDRIAGAADELGLILVWLGPNDTWPHCEVDCYLVGDSPGLP